MKAELVRVEGQVMKVSGATRCDRCHSSIRKGDFMRQVRMFDTGAQINVKWMAEHLNCGNI